MTPEKELLLAIIKQAVRDYMKLDPDSDQTSAEFCENEGLDYKTAEDFLYNNARIFIGRVSFTFKEACLFLDIQPKKIKKIIAKEAVEY